MPYALENDSLFKEILHIAVPVTTNASAAAQLKQLSCSDELRQLCIKAYNDTLNAGFNQKNANFEDRSYFIHKLKIYLADNIEYNTKFGEEWRNSRPSKIRQAVSLSGFGLMALGLLFIFMGALSVAFGPGLMILVGIGLVTGLVGLITSSVASINFSAKRSRDKVLDDRALEVFAFLKNKPQDNSTLSQKYSQMETTSHIIDGLPNTYGENRSWIEDPKVALAAEEQPIHESPEPAQQTVTFEEEQDVNSLRRSP